MRLLLIIGLLLALLLVGCTVHSTTYVCAGYCSGYGTYGNGAYYPGSVHYLEMYGPRFYSGSGR